MRGVKHVLGKMWAYMGGAYTQGAYRRKNTYMWEFFIKKMSPTFFVVMNYVRSLP